MSAYDSETFQPKITDRWDIQEKVLHREKNKILSRDLEDIDLDFSSGNVRIEEASGDVAELVIRLQVQAGDQQTAKDYLDKEMDSLVRVRTTGKQLTVETRNDNSVFSGGGMVVSGRSIVIGNISGGNISVGGGEVWINGRKVTPGQGMSPDPVVLSREMILKLPKDKITRGNLRLSSGKLTADMLTGRHTINTASADVSIGRFSGEMNLQAASGDTRISHFEGMANINAASGDVKIKKGVFRQSSMVRTTSGDVEIGVANDSLEMQVDTNSGDIDVDHDLNITKDTRESGRSAGNVVVINSGSSVISIGGGNGRSVVEGYFGTRNQPTDRLSVTTASGDVEISKI